MDALFSLLQSHQQKSGRATSLASHWFEIDHGFEEKGNGEWDEEKWKG